VGFFGQTVGSLWQWASTLQRGGLTALGGAVAGFAGAPQKVLGYLYEHTIVPALNTLWAQVWSVGYQDGDGHFWSLQTACDTVFYYVARLEQIASPLIDVDRVMVHAVYAVAVGCGIMLLAFMGRALAKLVIGLVTLGTGQ